MQKVFFALRHFMNRTHQKSS